MLLVMMKMLLLLQLTVGGIYASDNAAAGAGFSASARGQGQGQLHSQGQGSPQHTMPKFNSVEEVCDWLCQRGSPHFNYGCPPSCDGGVLGEWSKRSARGRRFDDFSFGFDDYLFMKLLGRDLGDRA